MYSIQNTEFTIENKIIKGVEEPCLENNKRNFGQVLFNSICKHGNRISRIKVETGEQRSYADVKDCSVRCALWLKKQGIKAKDTVVLCTNNQLDTCIPAIATLYVGALLTNWDHNHSLERHRFYLSFLQPKVIFACEASISLIQEAVKLEKISTKCVVFGKCSGFESLTDIMIQQLPNEIQKYQPEEKANPLDPAIILFSSGTSGTPKAITLSYDSLLENILSFCPSGCVTALYYSAMIWISGIYLTFYFLLTGSTVILHENGFNPKETFKVIEQYKINWAFFNPSGMTQCYKEKILSDYKLLSLKTILTGGTSISSEVHQAFRDSYPHVTIIFAYGLSEFGSLATYNLGNGKSIDSIGFVRPNKQLKVIDVTTKKALGHNEQGEICLKSRGIMTGYYKNPLETRNIIDEEGWLHTGDLGHYDESGEIFLTGRLKEIMNCRSTIMAPVDIERLLLRHPDVLEVAVVSVPHDLDGDQPMAFVKKSAGSQLTEEELIELSSTIGNGIKLFGGVKFMDELPLTVSGKISRHKLMELAKKYKEL